MKKPLNHRVKAAQDRIDFGQICQTKTKKTHYKQRRGFELTTIWLLSDAFTNKPLEEDGRTA